MKQTQVPRNRKKQRGQTLVLFCLMVPVFFGMAGLSIDSGMSYRTASTLSRGVDATALRLVGNYQQTASVRQQVALGFMQKDVPEFMNGSNVGSWTDSSGNSGGSANYGSTNSSTGEVMQIQSTDKIPVGYPNAGKAKSSFKMTTQIDEDTGVMTVTLAASVTHENFFMQLFGSKFRFFQFTNTATVNRFPAVNVLVLDISASMYGNGGALGIMGDGTTSNPGAVMLFANQFDETRDYLMVVTFSSRASVIWPTIPEYKDTNGIPYFGPHRNFKSGYTTASGASVPSLQTVMSNYLAYCSVDGQGTNGQEGLRYAAENVQKWLDLTVNSTVSQNLMRINYIFMTDGGFNLERTYAMGPGFGLPNTGSGAASSGTTSRLSVHNTFHDYAPIVGNCIGQSNGSDTISSWAGYSLTGLFGTYNKATAMPGVNVNLFPTDVSTNTKVWVPQTLSAATSPNTGVNYTIATTYASGTAGTAARKTDNTSNPFWPYVLLGPKSGSFYQVLGDYLTANYSGTNYTNQLNNCVINEQDKLAMKDPNTSKTSTFHRLILPLQMTDPIQNPARGTDFYLAANGTPTTYSGSTVYGNETGWYASGSTVTRTNFTGNNSYSNSYNYVWLPETYYKNYGNYYSWLKKNSLTPASSPGFVPPSGFKQQFSQTSTNQNLAMTDISMDSFPVGAFFANHAGTVLKEMSLASGESYGSYYAPSKTKNPYSYWPSNTEGYYSRSVRMTDYYPDYTMVGDATQLASSGSSSSNSTATAKYWWSFQSKSWQSSGNTTNDSYWLADAQAYVLRYKDTTGSAGYNGLPSGQNATFYVVGYSSDSKSTNLTDMANDPTQSAHYDSNQNPGQFFQVIDSSNAAQTAQLQQTFQQIAQQIAVRISK